MRRQGSRHRRPGVAGRDHRRRLPVAHPTRRRLHQGGVLLAMDPAGVFSTPMTVVAGHGSRPWMPTHLLGGPTSTIRTAWSAPRAPSTISPEPCRHPWRRTATGRVVSTSGVDARPAGSSQSTSTAWRPLYQPQLGQTTCGVLDAGSAGSTPRAGRPSRHAAAWWLRPLASDSSSSGQPWRVSKIGSGRSGRSRTVPARRDRGTEARRG